MALTSIFFRANATERSSPPLFAPSLNLRTPRFITPSLSPPLPFFRFFPPAFFPPPPFFRFFDEPPPSGLSEAALHATPPLTIWRFFVFSTIRGIGPPFSSSSAAMAASMRCFATSRPSGWLTRFLEASSHSSSPCTLRASAS